MQEFCAIERRLLKGTIRRGADGIDHFGLPDNELIDRAAKVAVVALPLRQTLQSFQRISRDTLRRNYRIYGNKYY